MHVLSLRLRFVGCGAKKQGTPADSSYLGGGWSGVPSGSGNHGWSSTRGGALAGAGAAVIPVLSCPKGAFNNDKTQSVIAKHQTPMLNFFHSRL